MDICQKGSELRLPVNKQKLVATQRLLLEGLVLIEGGRGEGQKYSSKECE